MMMEDENRPLLPYGHSITEPDEWSPTSSKGMSNSLTVTTVREESKDHDACMYHVTLRVGPQTEAAS